MISLRELNEALPLDLRVPSCKLTGTYQQQMAAVKVVHVGLAFSSGLSCSAACVELVREFGGVFSVSFIRQHWPKSRVLDDARMLELFHAVTACRVRDESPVVTASELGLDLDLVHRLWCAKGLVGGVHLPSLSAARRAVVCWLAKSGASLLDVSVSSGLSVGQVERAWPAGVPRGGPETRGSHPGEFRGGPSSVAGANRLLVEDACSRGLTPARAVDELGLSKPTVLKYWPLPLRRGRPVSSLRSGDVVSDS